VKPEPCPADVRINAQFKADGRDKINVVLLAFIHRARWAEIPLLADNISPGAGSIRQPPEHEFLSPLAFFLSEDDTNDLDCLWLVEQQANSLKALNSDYPSLEAAERAIVEYFDARNQYFRENPTRAGRKIWGLERVESEFRETNNCKDPLYR
jgi:hypothetical protein